MTDSKRAYSSNLRDRQARQTRRQIVAAAGRLFAERGWAATTISAVAEEAGVSRKTVFTAAGGKAALVKLAYDWALVGDDEPIPVIERPEIQRLRVETDLDRILEGYTRHIVSVMERTAPIYLALRDAADADPEAAAVLAETRAERLRGMSDFAARLESIGALRPGLSRRRAADLLWFHIDPVHWELLTGDRGWSVASYREWLTRSLEAHLLAPRRA